MGTGLQDQVAQGQATGDEFRTAPLWGVGQRIFFLHDTAGCQFNPLPEDPTNLADAGISNSAASDYSSDIVNFAAFARLSAAPQPAPPNASTAAPATCCKPSKRTPATAPRRIP